MYIMEGSQQCAIHFFFIHALIFIGTHFSLCMLESLATLLLNTDRKQQDIMGRGQAFDMLFFFSCQEMSGISRLICNDLCHMETYAKTRTDQNINHREEHI